MSSGGQALGGIVGGSVGFIVGGPSGALYGAQIGMMAGGYIDPPKGPVINGARLDDLNVQTSTYGAFIPRNYGTMAQNCNVFWVQGDSLIEVRNTTTSGGKGGPQTTTNTWSYYATFSVGLCKGPIDGIRRIWIGNQLWYDAGSSTLADIIASNQKADQFTLYLGTDTQAADPLIQADKGVANVPAYRGLAYIVFDRLPLADYSNSLLGAQVKVEIVKSGTTASPVLIDYTDIAGYPVSYYPSTLQSIEDGVFTFYGWDSVAGYSLVGGVNGVYTPNDETVFKVDFLGNYLGGSSVPADVVRPQIASNGQITLQVGTLGFEPVWFPEYSFNYAIGNGDREVIPYGTIRNRNTTTAAGDLGDLADSLTGESGRYVIGMVCSQDGTRIIVFTGAVNNGSADKYFILDSDRNVVKSGTISNTMAYLWSMGIATGNPNAVTSMSFDTYDGWTVTYPTSTGFLAYYFHIDSADVLQVGSAITVIIHTAVELAAVYSDGVFYVLHHDGSTRLRMYRFTANPTITPNTVSLASIVQAECLTSNLLTAGDLDVTELTDTVRGYRVTQLGAIRGGLDPLRAAFPFDVMQHGYQIKFKRRGSAAVATIASTELDARSAGAAPGVQITTVREMDSMLPRRVSISYVDITREYDVNQQYYERLNTDAVSEKSVELPIVFNAGEAAKKAETLLYLYWMERYDVSLVLPPTYANLEPGDVITVTSPAADYELRLTSANTLPDGRIECAAKFNQAALYTPTAIGEEGKSTGGLLSLDGPCVYSLLDIPLLRDADDMAGFPVAMSGYLSGWPGGVLYRSDDDGQTWSDLVAFAPGATIGYATGSLSTHGGTVYDFASTLTVWLHSGTLASVTEAQLFAGQNWFAYGADGRWEIIAARTATLQGDGSYILQDFLRGQQGTEWATGLHAANDRIILLDTTNLAFISVNSSTIGTARDYRGITTGKSLDSDSSLAFTYQGVNLECLSPVGLTGNRNPSTSDWTLTWIRRSRMPGWYDYVDVPLGETSESYEIDIYSDGTYTTVKRTLTAATPTVAYTSAQQTTDFGSNQATLYLKLYQLSATVGRGYALTQSITR